jgi:hypothetical protein
VDRLSALLDPSQTTWNGIDFVAITTDDQTGLAVHFLNTVAVQGTLVGVKPISITGGETVPAVPVNPVAATDWSVDADGRPVLALTTPYPGDFSFYELTIESTALDPYYSTVSFSFKARCPSDLDCEQPPAPCPPEAGDPPPIDYLAKDFRGFCQALMDFSALRYPAWSERSEADLGMMLLELLAAEADDHSYYQDGVAAQGTLATATERRSIVRHARMVDYEPSPATSAQVVVQLDVAVPNAVPPGCVVTAPLPGGATIDFEVGPGLVDPDTGGPSTAPVVTDPRWNRDSPITGLPVMPPYWWDDSKRCLLVGATEMWVLGHGHGLPTGDPANDVPGIALLIDTAAATTADPPIREVVHLTGAVEQHDPLAGLDVTHLTWSAAEALSREHDLTRTSVAGNLVPASEGRRHRETFVIEPSDPTAGPAVVRTGPNVTCDDPSPIYLHTLTQGRLAWLAAADASDPPLPEILLTGQGPELGDPVLAWNWRRTLLEAELFERAFTIDPVRYANVNVTPGAAPWWEYDGDGGDSIRFGDDVFGETPASGTEFRVTYRVTQGLSGNVGADTITAFDPAMAGVIVAVTNPFAATGGADPEPTEQIQRLAPYAFQAIKKRAVTAPDYESAAEELPWVLDAGTRFRWTGSWITVFTTADPRGREQIPITDHVGLIQLLERRRLTGYESYAPAPHYVGLDLIIVVCAQSDAFRSEVHEAVAVELGTGRRADGTPAFFAFDQFRFGTPLERSALEAAAQRANGVDGTVEVLYRRRGFTPSFRLLPEVLVVADDEIIRVDNDASRPDRGSLRVVVEGGK